jgi:SagB-type dehydrogenase family enzyme
VQDEVERIRAYHRLSKHHLDRFAPGPTVLDWANQPDPFRRFEGAPRVELPLGADRLRTRFSALQHPHGVAPHPVTRRSVGLMLELALGLSAWKDGGSARWALRCNPSSGNLHPTEGYIVCPDLDGLEAGVYHYVRHALEQRARCTVSRDSPAFATGGVMVVLTSVFWREAWKYGVRAYRYCQHDVGHAIGAVTYAAAGLGWRTTMLDAWGDDDLARLVGIHRAADFEGAEHESPDVAVWVGPRQVQPEPDRVLATLVGARWTGRANRLSASQVPWRPIEVAEKAARKRRTPSMDQASGAVAPAPVQSLAGAAGVRAAHLIQSRRSAVAFDGHTYIDRAAFFRMLDSLVPRSAVAPWSAIPWSPRIHPVLFVHRVEGVVPGLYAVPRSARAAVRMRAAMRSDWLWHEVEDAPSHVPLRLLLPLDVKIPAATVSCHQAIAADGCFAMAMMAEFDRSLEEGAYGYRRLHWEAGVLGQALYLHAEREGVRATGIGCFFDDAVHELLGLKTTEFQTVYHFTVGGSVDDPRLRSHPPYEHLPER